MSEPRTESSVGTPPSSDNLGALTYSKDAPGASQRYSDTPAEMTASSESIVIVDFGFAVLSPDSAQGAGGQRLLRAHSTHGAWETVEHLNPKGVILSGGPASVYDDRRAACSRLGLRLRHPRPWHLLRNAGDGPPIGRTSRAWYSP